MCRIIEPGLLNMRSATAGVGGSSRRLPRPRLPPACSFFSGEKKGRAFGAVDVVRQSPQILILSLGSTTSLDPFGPPALRTWCSKVRKSLFLRREAPRPWTHPGLRRRGRGASRHANPYSFVGRHHVPEPIRAFGAADVVLQGPQILIPSSGGTTSLCPSESPAHRLCAPPIQFIYTYFFVKMLNRYTVIIYNPIATSSGNKKQQEDLCESDLICSPSWKEKK